MHISHFDNCAIIKTRADFGMPTDMKRAAKTALVVNAGIFGFLVLVAFASLVNADVRRWMDLPIFLLAWYTMLVAPLKNEGPSSGLRSSPAGCLYLLSMALSG
jgi:hypothetical protein